MGEGWWQAPQPEGPFTYVEFYVDDIAYNVHDPDGTLESSIATAHASDSITVCVEDQMRVLAPGYEHIVALAPPAPIGPNIRKSGHASPNSVR